MSKISYFILAVKDPGPVIISSGLKCEASSWETKQDDNKLRYDQFGDYINSLNGCCNWLASYSTFNVKDTAGAGSDG